MNRGDHSEISTYISNVIENDFSGNVIDVCPVGALTDRTFRFKSRVWFLKPMDAHRDCPTCSGKVTAWMHSNQIYRITARKDKYGEVEEFICNTCRFEKKELTDWTVEGPRMIDRHSVIGQNHFEAPYKALLNESRKMIGAKKDLLNTTPDVNTMNNSISL
jgi:NADH-quinone oxidoreductase subunit G